MKVGVFNAQATCIRLIEHCYPGRAQLFICQLCIVNQTEALWMPGKIALHKLQLRWRPVVILVTEADYVTFAKTRGPQKVVRITKVDIIGKKLYRE